MARALQATACTDSIDTLQATACAGSTNAIGVCTDSIDAIGLGLSPLKGGDKVEYEMRALHSRIKGRPAPQ